jgi:hypothetical protein
MLKVRKQFIVQSVVTLFVTIECNRKACERHKASKNLQAELRLLITR